jgi:serine/threonine protein kinase
MHSLESYGLDGWYVEMAPKSIEFHHTPTPSRTLYSVVKDEWMVYPPLSNGTIPMYTFGSVLAEGTYGRIYHVKREIATLDSSVETLTRSGTSRNIVIKESSATVHEAILHAIIHKLFKTIGLGSVIPELYEACVRKVNNNTSFLLAMEWIQGSTLLQFFHIYLTKITNAAKVQILPTSLEVARKRNDELLIDILVQTAMYLHIMQTKLKFNHRDLKLNNVLIRHTSSRSRSILRRIDHPLLSKPWDCKYDLVIIDFGFSCVACETKESKFEAGSFFKPDYHCMKEGRDLALLLYSIHAFFPLDQYISPSLWTFLQSCMIANQGTKQYQLLEGVQLDGTPGPPVQLNEGVYKFLRENCTEIPSCVPATFLQSIQSIV